MKNDTRGCAMLAPMAGNMVLYILITIILAVLLTPIANASTPAIFVFGDSLADVGNNNYLPGIFKANFPHNGIDYPFGLPTGRFSNGYNVVDLLAKKMGFLGSPPPFLSLTSAAQMLKGVNFASGGSGILDITGAGQSIPLKRQLMYFEGVTLKLRAKIGKLEADLLLSKSIIFLSTGSNDLLVFQDKFGPQTTAHKEQFISLLSLQYKYQLKILYKLGARKFAILGLAAIGCVPYQRLRSRLGNCVEELNDLARQFNTAMKAHLQELSFTLRGMKYSFLDSYGIAFEISFEPLKYGFKEIYSACCGAGKLNAASPCTPIATYCLNRHEHLFWDLIHPTQAFSQVLAEMSYDGRIFATPRNVKQLASI